MTPLDLVFRYSFFAILASMANLAIQRGVLLYGNNGFVFAIAIGFGTLVGLVLKYFLDKRWIFVDTEYSLKSDSKKFSVYTVMGVITTVIFWLSEVIFWLIWQTEIMREVGAIIGLSIGYAVKYQLDRRYVFTNKELENLR